MDSQREWFLVRDPQRVELNSVEQLFLNLNLNLNEYVAGSKNSINATEERKRVTILA